MPCTDGPRLLGAARNGSGKLDRSLTCPEGYRALNAGPLFVRNLRRGRACSGPTAAQAPGRPGARRRRRRPPRGARRVGGAPWRGVPIVHPGGQAAGKREKRLGRRRLNSCRSSEELHFSPFVVIVTRALRSRWHALRVLPSRRVAPHATSPPAPLYERATPPRRVTGACHAAAGQLDFPLQPERGRWFETPPAGRRCRGRPSSC